MQQTKLHPQRCAIGNGVHFTSITDPKFTKNRISMCALLPLTEETASDNTIVTLLLRKGSRTYPDFTALNARLNELYGAVLATSVSRFNRYQVLTLTVQALDNRFALENENIISECTSLLVDLLLHPALDENNRFPSADVALERQYILDSIAAEINDKPSYATAECVRHLTKGTTLAVRSTGDLETAKRITAESATIAWERMRDTAYIEFFFTGSGDPNSAKTIIEESFAPLERTPISLSIVPLDSNVIAVEELEARMDVQQGNLVLGFKVDGSGTPEYRNAARLFSSLYGASPVSKLFLNVREKLSLCYYCSSSMDSINNTMIVSSGIEFDKKSLAQEEILRQLDLMKQGDFSKQEIATSKLMLKNSLSTIGDSLSYLENWYFQHILLGEDTSPADDSARIDAVTREQIINIAQGIRLNTVYFLHGKE